MTNLSCMSYLNAAQRVCGESREVTVTLVDGSPSMDATDYEPSRRRGAIEANCRLIEAKAGTFPDDEIGVIAFSGSAVSLHPLVAVGPNRELLLCSLRGDIPSSGGTDFTVALELAGKCLSVGPSTTPTRPGRLARILDYLLLETEGAACPPPSVSAGAAVTKRIIKG